MKIVMLGPNLKGQGGMTSVVVTLLGSELAKKNEITYIQTHTGKNVIFKVLIFFQAIVLLIPKLLSPSVKLIHIHSAQRISFYRKSVFVFLSRLFRKKVILHIHGAEFDVFYQKAGRLKKKYIRCVLSKCLVIALSIEWKKKLEKICTKNTEIKILYNPVVISQKIKKKNNTTKIILFLGYLGKRKGTYDLIKAVESLKHKDFVLLMGGDGEVEQVQQIIEKNKLQNKIKLLGWVVGKQKEDLLNSADIYVLPSYHEGLPISVLEAMAHGLPVISTTVGGIPEAIENNKSGFLIKPGDVNELSKKMNLLISNAELREKMGLNAYNTVKNKFDVKIIVKELQKIYEEIGK